jgi:hypothetical protein
VDVFKANESHYLSPDYRETEVGKDFIDKSFIATGWSTLLGQQRNP